MKPLLARHADPEADAVLARLRAARPDWGRSGGGNRRGLPREMLATALMLELNRPGELARHLERAAAAFARLGERSPAALRKCASHARAFLHYGRTGGRSLAEAAADLDPGAPDVVDRVEALVRALDLSGALAQRIEDLGGVRGGRPSAPQLRALSAVISLVDRAQAGDGLAATEIDLIRSYLTRRAA